MWTLKHILRRTFRAQELCESRGGRPGLPVPKSLYGLCGRKATFEEEDEDKNSAFRNSCCKSKLRSTQVAWHWRGLHLLNIVVLAVADGLFGLYGSERWDELFIGT